MELILKNTKDTEQFGYKLGKILKGGEIICLIGDLGAGKTTMTKSIAKGLDVEEYVTSPTFTLINEYRGRVPLYHFDVYRLEEVESIYDLGFEEYFYSNGVSIIEWANKIKNVLPEDVLTIEINRGSNDEERILNIYGSGERNKSIIEELKRD
ncbi:tRNA (adenosine(37)-N6)-threonylcarbamoyltransferase complex ATPase subunit type 1 TsaE [Sporanaerobacter acetigenes]|uniref:tRNA threonylcarbamoyladenosine biosynthesis protein TsaE n=1 Tax=Sporanaerobacter acetigenes DSM 13106 TaxID=1123281 RepID=A0A1M5SEB7_9FIRM|nr:tRNA (adenosine(37)-N6)-threonylcarbamoyltransferase complex ATPase subunit type 1 TsaE [Sporanaerobacter acetigenes]SHH36618.1 tRNA threonylcarbamoyladenosine biosynthesis protein TsaE [Sporanaerobacter acetigenes DSM 13106]